MTATNAAGISAVGAASLPAVPNPAGPPDVPLLTGLVGRPGAVIVGWSAPANVNGSALTGYTLKVTQGATTTSTTWGAQQTQAEVTGLVDGTSAAVSLVARNGIGASSAATGTVTPRVAYVPGAPQQLSARPSGSGSVVVSWQAPLDDGGSAVTAYRVTHQQVVPNATNSGWVPAAGASPTTRTVPATTTTTLLTGFTPSTGAFQITVAAVNAVGVGAVAGTGSPVTPTTTLKAGVVVLSSASTATVSQLANGVLAWAAPVPAQVAALEVGTVLVAATSPSLPAGLLARVTAIDTGDPSQVVVTTTSAAVTDVFASATITQASDPLSTPSAAPPAGQPSTPSIRAMTPGVRVLPRTTKAATGTVAFENSLTLAVNLESLKPFYVKGQVKVSSQLGLSLTITQGLLGVPNGARASAFANTTVTASLEAGIKGSKEWKLAEITGVPATVFAGPVPVVVVPKFPVFLKVDGSIAVQVSASGSIGGSINWSSAAPDSLNFTNTSTPFKVTGGSIAGLSVTGAVGVEAKVQPSYALYGVAGPSISAGVRADASLTLPVPQGQPWLTISVSRFIRVGFAASLLGWHADLEKTIAATVVGTFTSTTAPPAVLSTTPTDQAVAVGGTVQFAAVRSDGTNPSVSWSLLGAAGDSITTSGLLRAVAPAGRTLTVIAKNADGTTGRVAVTIGIPFDTVTGLTARQSQTDLAATVTWTAPTRTGGSAIDRYILTTSPTTTTQSLRDTAAALDKLAPGDYVITITPVNSAGQAGPSTTTALHIYPLCTITFTGGSNGTGTNWNTATNWAPNRVPTASDWVCSTLVPTLTTAVTVAGLRAQSITLTNGSLTVTSYGELDGMGTAAGLVDA